MLREQLDSPQIVEDQHQRRDNYHQEQEEQHILDGSDGCGESYALRCAAPKKLEAVEVKETRHEGNVIAGERTPLLPPPSIDSAKYRPLSIISSEYSDSNGGGDNGNRGEETTKNTER